VTTLAPQITAIEGRQGAGLVDFTVPIYTAIGQLTSFMLGYKPQLVRLQRRHRSDDRRRPAEDDLEGQGVGTGLIEGAITDGYLPSSSDTSNPWIQLFLKIHAQYDASAPFDGNVEYGMANAYTLVQALQAAGKNLTRSGLVKAVENDGAKWMGPGLVPFRYSATEHGGYGGAEIGQVRGGKIVLFGGPLQTAPTSGSPIMPYAGKQPSPPASGVPSN